MPETLATMDRTGGHKEVYARFKVDRYIGRGSLGTVYVARPLDAEDDIEVAIKEIEAKQLTEEEREAAIIEISKLSAIAHSCVTPIYEVFGDRTSICMVMGYVPGKNLGHLIQQGAGAGRPMQETLVWKYFIQMCRGLAAYHFNGILHRNIKPSNIHVMGGQRLLIGEPGMIELLKATKGQTMVNVPRYLAPEVWQGQPYGFPADIWALGCVLYELCTYKVPFEARSPQELRGKVCRGRFAPISAKFSPELAKVVYSLLATDPAQRPNIEQVLSSAIVRHYSSVLLPEDDVVPQQGGGGQQ